jgi:hypothetical protein
LIDCRAPLSLGNEFLQGILNLKFASTSGAIVMESVRVKCALLATAILNITCFVALSQSVDKNKSSARVCLAVMSSGNGEEVAFQATSQPGAGKKIVAHIEANAKCEAVIAAFNRKTGRLAYGWPPQYAEVAKGNELLLPRAPISWNWTNDAGPIELHVLIFAPGSKESVELKNLIAAMQGAKTEPVTSLQTNKLRELIGRAKVDKAGPERVAKDEKAEVAGAFRMVIGFEWRDSARTVNFSPDKPGALVFP